VKPKRRKRKKKKGSKDKKGVTKDSGDKGGKSEKKTETTEVDSVPVGEMEIDDKWADMVDKPTAASPSPATEVEQPAPAVVKENPDVNPGVIADVLELGYKDSLLKRGTEATVVNYDRATPLNSETVTLSTLDGTGWVAKVETGHARGMDFQVPSLNGSMALARLRSQGFASFSALPAPWKPHTVQSITLVLRTK